MNTKNNSTGNGYGHKGTATGHVAKKTQNGDGTQKNPQDLYRRNF